MSFSVYVAYLAACMVIVIVPGPTVTLIIANSILHGTRGPASPTSPAHRSASPP